MNYPKTPDEWWNQLNDNWDSIKSILLKYYPNQADFPEDGWPLPRTSLQNPQKACNCVIKDITQTGRIWQTKSSLADHLEALRESKDIEIARIVNSTWFGLPESPSIRSTPGFFVFCDLCSESRVLYENEGFDGDDL